MAQTSDISKQLPSMRTFAPSREDVLSTLGFFFGDPAVPEKLNDYSEHRTQCFFERTNSSFLQSKLNTLRRCMYVCVCRCHDVPLSGCILCAHLSNPRCTMVFTAL
jgi:hypothetical protein